MASSIVSLGLCDISFMGVFRMARGLMGERCEDSRGGSRHATTTCPPPCEAREPSRSVLQAKPDLHSLRILCACVVATLGSSSLHAYCLPKFVRNSIQCKSSNFKARCPQIIYRFAAHSLSCGDLLANLTHYPSAFTRLGQDTLSTF